MAKRRLLWQLYLPYLIITILALVLLSWYASYSFRWFYYDEVARDLKSRTELAERDILTALDEKKFDEVDHLCKLLGKTADFLGNEVGVSKQVVEDVGIEDRLAFQRVAELVALDAALFLGGREVQLDLRGVELEGGSGVGSAPWPGA